MILIYKIWLWKRKRRAWASEPDPLLKDLKVVSRLLDLEDRFIPEFFSYTKPKKRGIVGTLVWITRRMYNRIVR